MSVFAANLEALEVRHPMLVESLRRIRKESPDVGTGVEVKAAHNRGIYLEVAVDGRTTRLHSSYDPYEEANNWARATGGKGQHFVLFGFGAGYHAEALLQREGVRRLVAVEPDVGILLKALAARPMIELFTHPRFHLLVGAEAQPMADLLSPIFYEMTGTGLTVEPLPAYRRLYPEVWRELRQMLEGKIRSTRVDVVTRSHMSRQWASNVIYNLPHMLEAAPLENLFGQFQGTPIVIASSGPSLSENLPLLKELQERALILAAGSSFNGLLKGGVRPHLIVSTDGGRPNYDHFEGVRLSDVPLAFSPSIYPAILNEYAGPHLMFLLGKDGLMHYFARKAGMEKQPLSSGPSVANTVFELALRLGGDPIIFVGQDLAFPDDEVHADGVRGMRFANGDYRKGYVWVPDVRGGMVQTIPSFDGMLKWFESYISHLVEPPVIINTSSKGARIQGTNEMPLTEAVRQFARVKVNPGERIRRLLEDRQVVSEGGNVDRILAQFRAELDEFYELGSQGVKEAGRLHDLGSSSRTRRMQLQSRRVEDLLRRAEAHPVYPVIQELLEHRQKTLIGRDRAELAAADSPQAWARLRAEQTKRYFSDFVGAVDFLKEILERQAAFLQQLQSG